ncbi:MAG: GIY-YIG nuclease family protein [Candidatus Sulfotelmatobacter sp.]
MKEHQYSVYMIASKSRVLYIGMTNDLHRRVCEHKNDLIKGFTRQYRCHRLVYYESFDDVNKAIDREKQLKRWNRTKKDWLIEQRNPTCSLTVYALPVGSSSLHANNNQLR